MNRRSDGTIVIGTREIIFGALVLAVLVLVALVIVLAAARLGGNRQVADITVTPGNTALVTATPDMGSGPTATPLNLGATLPPNRPTPTIQPETFTHSVRAGETLSSIAALYGIDLQTLLLANGLSLDSVIQENQQLVIPLPPSQAGTWHTVQPGETLTIIANRYGASVEAIRAANGLNEDSVIFSGQQLRIPGVAAQPEESPSGGEEAAATPIAQAHSIDELPTRAFLSDWPRSILEGNLDENYPLRFSQDRFTVHYQPGTYAGENLGQTMGLADDALRLIENRLGVHLDGSFDVYVAGTLFEAPNAHLRGLSNSSDRQVFILHDGTGTATDNAYFFTHELTHMVTRNTWGSPGAAFVLSEGVATWVGRPILEDGGYLKYDEICAAVYAAERLPTMTAIETDWQAFLGHIRDPFNYFGAACFVDFIVDTYGMDALRQLYVSSDYEGVTGRSLAWLDTEFRGTLESNVPLLSFDPNEFVSVADDVRDAYRFVFSNYNSTEVMQQAYVAVDQARVALWKGDLVEARRWLATAYDITGYTP